MASGVLAELGLQIARLSSEEQLWLIEHLALRLRERAPAGREALERALAVMAADPEVQKEIRAIEEEYRALETGVKP